jgi:predicted protein tyrosine phosphatase
MPFIENVPLMDIVKGHHRDAGENSVLIQIVDNDMDFPKPAASFKETHKFKFLDVEGGQIVLEPEFRISDFQAGCLVEILKSALAKDMNVIVHCHAGVCRSGAVCEVGVMMGFNDCKRYRQPNLLVKHKMIQVLGWTYDPDEGHNLVDGTGFD